MTPLSNIQKNFISIVYYWNSKLNYLCYNKFCKENLIILKKIKIKKHRIYDIWPSLEASTFAYFSRTLVEFLKEDKISLSHMFGAYLVADNGVCHMQNTG